MALILTRRVQPLRGLVDLAPALNVILLLLCFFLLSSSFILQPGIKVNLPRSVYAEGSPASRLIVAVTLGPQEVDDKGAPLPRQPVMYFNDQIVTLDSLREALDQLPASRIKPTLIVKPDKDVPVDVISNLMDAAGPRFDFEIATQPVGGGAGSP
jgi:biopolymer transport protein ExbD